MRRGHISHKLDAYSAGVVVAELLTGKNPAAVDLGSLIEDAVEDGTDAVLAILDTREGVGEWDLEKALVVAGVVLACMHTNPRKRSEVSAVLADLEGAAGMCTGLTVVGDESKPQFDSFTGEPVNAAARKLVAEREQEHRQQQQQEQPQEQPQEQQQQHPEGPEEEATIPRQARTRDVKIQITRAAIIFCKIPA